MMSRLKSRLSPRVQSGTVSKLKDRLESGTSKTSDIIRAREKTRAYRKYVEDQNTARRQSADYSEKYDEYNKAFEDYKGERDEYIDTLSEWKDKQTRTKERNEFLSTYEQLQSKVSGLQSAGQRISGTTDKDLTEFQ